MPNLPPLPLVDGWLFVDNSFLEKMTTCTRAAEYSFLHRRTLADKRSALHFGGAIHRALEHRYIHGADQPSSDVEHQQLNIIAEEFATTTPVDGEYRTQSLASQIIRFYNKKYISEPFDVLLNAEGKPMVETSFAFPLVKGLYYSNSPTESKFINLMYTGRIDLSVREGQQHFTMDHKTAFMLGTGFFEEQAMNAQHVGYCWGFQRTTGITPNGYYINAIRVRPPAKTRDAVVDDDFQRERFYITPERITEWESNTIALIEEFLWHHARDYMPMKTKWCVGKYGRCPYYDVCSIPAAHRPLMLGSNLYIDDDWSPLKQVHANKG